jgi:hypothetical protein
VSRNEGILAAEGDVLTSSALGLNRDIKDKADRVTRRSDSNSCHLRGGLGSLSPASRALAHKVAAQCRGALAIGFRTKELKEPLVKADCCSSAHPS